MEACWKPAGRENHPETGTADLPPLEKELHIYNWSDYIAEDTVPNFEREFGVRVTYDTYESNEEMVAKLQAGASGYDIIVPSGYILPVLVATDLIAPLQPELHAPTPRICRRSFRIFRQIPAIGTPYPGSGGPVESHTGPTRSRARWIAGPCSRILSMPAR